MQISMTQKKQEKTKPEKTAEVQHNLWEEEGGNEGRAVQSRKAQLATRTC